MNLDTLLRRFPSKALKVWLGFFLAAYNKIQEERDQLRKKLKKK